MVFFTSIARSPRPMRRPRNSGVVGRRKSDEERSRKRKKTIFRVLYIRQTTYGPRLGDSWAIWLNQTSGFRRKMRCDRCPQHLLALLDPETEVGRRGIQLSGSGYFRVDSQITSGGFGLFGRVLTAHFR